MPRNPKGRAARRWWAVAIGVLFFVLVLFAVADKKLKPPAGSRLAAWREYSKNPVIRVGQQVKNTVWNDPSVMQDDDGSYRMWLSGGDPTDLKRIVVKAYAARSRDGIHWDIDPEPCLSPSANPKAWDSLRIETPAVIKVGLTYHMYYTGFDEEGARLGISAIGHATSPDGLRWTKDANNPVLRDQSTDKFRWAYRGVGEPGALYNPADKMIYLYYVGMRYSRENPTIGHIGILLARSKDGSRFTDYADAQGDRVLVLTHDVKNAIDGSLFGYTNPAPLIASDGKFHLFCTFLVCPKGPASARHVTIDQAVSDDGIHFNVIEQNIFEAARQDWKDHEVRSPSVVEDRSGEFKMWFAGETQTPVYGSGIGYATRRHQP